ncbi:MAG: hypothetical protein ACYDCQ_20460 [Dehalococcoidia bacterium]
MTIGRRVFVSVGVQSATTTAHIGRVDVAETAVGDDVLIVTAEVSLTRMIGGDGGTIAACAIAIRDVPLCVAEMGVLTRSAR